MKEFSAKIYTQYDHMVKTGHLPNSCNELNEKLKVENKATTSQ
jgi:hypothetical protein